MSNKLSSMEVVGLVKTLRTAAQIDQKDMAGRIGISNQQLSRWEQNRVQGIRPQQDESVRRVARELLSEFIDRV